MVKRILSFAWRYFRALASAVYLFSIGFIFPRNRELINHMYAHFGTERLPNPLVPVVAASELVANGLPIRVLEPDAVDGNISVFELMMIASLIQTLQPTRLFEIGTFDGRTALNLAANSLPGATVFTLDLPPDSANSTLLPLDRLDANYIANRPNGSRFAGTEYEKKIVRLWGDSATFDISPFVGTMDLLFVDGAHSYQYALQDSATALRLLRKDRGVILWHDYARRCWPGVTQALNELFARGGVYRGLRRIEGTSLVCLAFGAQAGTLLGPVGEAVI